MEVKGLEHYNIVHHTLGGSHRYGTQSADSDYDYRCVYVRPTKSILSDFFSTPKTNIQFIDGQYDYRIIEVGHFFSILAKSNPNAMEILYSDDINGRDFFKRIKEVFFNFFDPYTFRKACMGMATSAMMDYERSGNAKYALEGTRVISMCKHAIQDHIVVLDIQSHDCYHRVLKPILRDKREGVKGVNKEYSKAYDEIMEQVKEIKLEPNDPDVGLLKSELYEIRLMSLKV